MTPPSNAGGEGREVLAREAWDGSCEPGETRWHDLPDAVRGRQLRAMLAFSARENAGDRAAYTYDVTWSRADGERLTCRDLSPRLVTARIIQAIKTSGPITIHAVEGRADNRAPALVEAAVVEGDDER